MYSIAFPNIIAPSGARTNLIQDTKATESNLRLLLSTTCGELFGDPDFGNLLITRIYEQNSTILVDLIIDDIYVAILTYLPQIVINRKDISVFIKGADVFTKIKCKNLIDYEINTYEIKLTGQDVI
jgi:phage baseplate assembly protein W